MTDRARSPLRRIATIALLVTALVGTGWLAIRLPAFKRHVFIAAHAQTRAVAALSHLRQRPVKTVIVGDSIVEFLQLDRLCGVPVLAAGVTGAQVDEIVDFSHRIVAAADPETIVVAIGVNDTVRGYETDYEAFTASYRRLIAPWTGGRARLALATLVPVADEGRLGREHFDTARIGRLNEIVRGLAAEKGLPVIPLDRLPTTASGGLRPDLTDDGVHPTPEGYRHWVAAIEGTICPK